MKRILFILGAVILLASCKEKKMIVLSKGAAVVNTDNKTIKATDGSGHNAQEFMIGSSKAVFKITAPAGETTVDLPDNGLYIVNINDTIIGSYQHFSDANVPQAVISQESLVHQIDSLQLLSEGKNVSAANRNFFILPNKAVKITDNTDAIVVGPYHRISSVEKVNGKDPEVYRFYSINEVREMLTKLRVLTTPKKI